MCKDNKAKIMPGDGVVPTLPWTSLTGAVSGGLIGYDPAWSGARNTLRPSAHAHGGGHMNPQAPRRPERESRLWGWAVLAAAVVIAVCGAHNYAGGWNDGSRLATAEALVDYHTWSIDASIFVRPDAVAPSAPSPYLHDDYLSMRYGTRDKL